MCLSLKMKIHHQHRNEVKLSLANLVKVSNKFPINPDKVFIPPRISFSNPVFESGFSWNQTV